MDSIYRGDVLDDQIEVIWPGFETRLTGRASGQTNHKKKAEQKAKRFLTGHQISLFISSTHSAILSAFR
ncbi:MAG: hypothetical protein ABJO01_12610 [Parasphingorhabdus sp.]|uniref:hypothetical protein n=1 Tax=Parasphingorhabdus sp. TaxID=2709688 RepID=UPI00329A715B